MDVVPKVFEYNTDVVSPKQFGEHIKLYNGYVEKFNQISGELKNDDVYKGVNSIYSKYRGLKSSETFSLDAIVLHELYFQNMDKGKSSPSRGLMDQLMRFFGNYENWLKDFVSCGKSARGWCAFIYDQRSHTLRNMLQDTHDCGVICGAFPLLALDVYEHAYFLDYGRNKDKYIEAFVSGINWDVVNVRFSRIEKQI